jgi:hypothetical protein
VNDFTKLSQATSADEYNSTLESINLSQALDTWAADVSALDAVD